MGMKIHNGGMYKVKVTLGILKKYFKKFNTTPEKLDRVGARLIFLSALKDFLNSKLKIDDLTYIATQLYYEMRKPDWYENYDIELASALADATEAAWYNWKQKDEYKRMVGRLKNYYEENKKLLEKIEE